MTGRSARSAAAGMVLALWSCGDDGTPTDPGPPSGANQAPVADFSVDVEQGAAPLPVSFDATGSNDPDGEIASYAWEFGDGSTATGVSVTHIYESPGYFVPRLTVTDDRGARATAVDSALIVTAPPGSGDGTISGVVWHDQEGSGERAAGDPGVPGMVVFLDDDDDGVRDAGEPYTVTDRQGQYAFLGVETDAPRTVTQQLSLGWTNTVAEISAAPSATDAGAAAEATDAAGAVDSSLPPGPSYVIGGSVADDDAYPFMVALLFATVPSNPDAFTCGGTFIASSWILTAAHCVEGLQASDFEVLVETNSLTSGGERVPVITIRVFPEFGANSFVGEDVALLEIDEEFMIPRSIPQTPAHPHLSSAGTPAFAVGWGRTLLGGSISTDLRHVEMPLISNGECQVMLDQEVVASTICAGTLGTEQSICNGDSGGPLLVMNAGRTFQVGITSFGQNCQPPIAFARVSEFIDWIESVVPPEPSMSVEVDWSAGLSMGVEFGNFR